DCRWLGVNSREGITPLWQSIESKSAQSFTSNFKRHSEGTFTSDFTRYLDKMKAKDFVHWLINTKRYR
uniref:Glucagon / GIP / secretin / VIP family domain-containing protein n=1 Tax=Sphenodon punctatus TaxID=8508 RepID=A0A8D0L5M5_SPHPU